MKKPRQDCVPLTASTVFTVASTVFIDVRNVIARPPVKAFMPKGQKLPGSRAATGELRFSARTADATTPLTRLLYAPAVHYVARPNCAQ